MIIYNNFLFPCYSDCCLKFSKMRVELLTDSTMLDFIEKAKRGGMTIGVYS